ncbi:MAG: chemotaxis protein CheW [Myxococcales bacterium]|nr:chemotaxis protein CheW [Myxococcales bacterium]
MKGPAPAPPPVKTVVPPQPPPTVRVKTEMLDRFLSTVGEVILNTSQVRTAASGDGPERNADLGTGLDRMDRVVGELQLRALDLRTTPLLRIVEPLPRMARDIAQRSGKRVQVHIEGGELELDRSILDRLSDPLVHLIRNAVDHGIETPEARLEAGKPEIGRLDIEARRVKDSIQISVRDDGRGMDLDAVRVRAVEKGLLHPDLAEDLPPHELVALVFLPGFSTAETVSAISGRGVGMDAVRVTIESLGGNVEIVTEAGRGTTTTLTVPITAAVQRVLLLALGNETVALPISRVERILELDSDQIETAGHESFVLIDDDPIPVIHLAAQLALDGGREDEPEQPSGREQGGVVTLILTDLRGERIALLTDRVSGQQQIYVKPVPELLATIRALAGLTILGDGRPVFVLDQNQLA